MKTLACQIDKEVFVDNSRSIELLGMAYEREMEETILDQLEVFI